MIAGRYFDHAATAYPRPAPVVSAVAEYLRDRSGNPGRGSHELALAAGRTLVEARQVVAQAFGHDDPERIVFTLNCTEALNVALLGTIDRGDEVVTTAIEHNAVSRPLMRLVDEAGVRVTRVPADADGGVDVTALERACTPRTRLVAVTAGSNVLGAATDLAALRPALGPEVLICVDAAQVAGDLPFSFSALGLDYAAIPAHKAIAGPPGVGLLLASRRVAPRVFREGGTGTRSELRRTPVVFPDGYEAGTGNGPGIAGLHAALLALDEPERARRAASRRAAWAVLVAELDAIAGIEILSCRDPRRALPLVSFRHAAVDPGVIEGELAARGFAVRAGLHCAPDAHQCVGSLATGLVRASLGPQHTPDDAAALAAAIRACVA